MEVWIGDEGMVKVSYMDPAFGKGEVVDDVEFVKPETGNPGPVVVATWQLGRLRERLLP